MQAKRLYIAAPFSAKQRVAALGEALLPLGYKLEARWLGHEYGYPGGIENPGNAQYARKSAEHDLEDAEQADLMIVLMEPHPGSHYGWLVELGIGLAKAEEVWMVGPAVNVFSFLHGIQLNGCDVRSFETVKELLEFARKEAGDEAYPCRMGYWNRPDDGEFDVGSDTPTDPLV